MNQPLMWSKKEGGRTAWTEEDYIAQVKLLFLLNLWSEYVVHVGEDPILKLFLEEIIGRPPFNQELFDRWWTVERYEGVDESFEDVVERLAMQNPQLPAESELPFTNAASSRSDNLISDFTDVVIATSLES